MKANDRIHNSFTTCSIVRFLFVLAISFSIIMSATASITVPNLLEGDKDTVLSVLGGIYEHSPWVAEAFYESKIANCGADNAAATSGSRGLDRPRP